MPWPELIGKQGVLGILVGVGVVVFDCILDDEEEEDEEEKEVDEDGKEHNESGFCRLHCTSFGNMPAIMHF